MIIKEDAKGLIIEKSINFSLPEEEAKKIQEKRNFFLKEFSKSKIAALDKEHYFQGKGVKQGNFTYELEWHSKILGGIGGGSIYKFGYEKDFENIKKLLIKIVSAGESINTFYTTEGNLTKFSKDVIEEAERIKGVRRALIGKVLSIYFPNIFMGVYTDQDYFLGQIYSDYKPETTGIELYLRNNYLLLETKIKYASNLNNEAFVALLYNIFGNNSRVGETSAELPESSQIDALEVDHYQSLIHRNFKHLFKGKLKYYDAERQNENHGHFDTQEVGIMDFLATDEKNNLVVIELKRASSDTTMGQILRYMGWVKKNICDSSKKVRGIIIAETKDNRLDYALQVSPDVEFKKMKLDVEIEEI